jgi:prepilin-type N-terminal cleavage/methylation domain-containing protein
MMFSRRARLLTHPSARKEKNLAPGKLPEQSRRFFIALLRRAPENDIHKPSPRLGLINKDQKGFTLLEMLLAILIGSLIAGGITATIFQVVIGSARTNNHMIAVRQVQNAGYWVSHDAQMAQKVVLARDADGFPLLTLEWTDWYGTPNEIHYFIEGGDLKRQVVSPQASETTVARFIDPDSAKTKCQLTGGGTFALPDINDTFTISSSAVPDSGKITVAAGGISVTTTGSATINGGATWTGTAGQSAPWTTPAAGTVSVRATATGTAGVWTSTVASATVGITTDTDGDAAITGGTGSALTFTVTVTVSPSSQRQSETRVYKIVPRPGSQ